MAGHKIAPDGIKAWNPAFDVTPASLITAIVTDKGVVRPNRQTGRKEIDMKAFCDSFAEVTLYSVNRCRTAKRCPRVCFAVREIGRMLQWQELGGHLRLHVVRLLTLVIGLRCLTSSA